jgi:oligopeptide/dipeptide ABC transporter ATP-binding protein
VDARRERLAVIPGMVPPATDFPSGCRFRNRCEKATETCGTALPELVAVGERGSRAACFHL